MARKAGMAKKGDASKSIIDTALRLAESRGWRQLTLADVATEAGVPLSAVYRLFPTKTDLLLGFLRMIDEAVLGEGAPDPDEPARDRLFDVLMRRFDALAPYKPGVKAIFDDLWRDPPGMAAQRHFGLSMRWMLEAASIPAEGAAGWARAQVLGLLYLSVMRTWFTDDSADMARTMAALDTRLRQAEQLANSLDPAARRARAGEAGA